MDNKVNADTVRAHFFFSNSDPNFYVSDVETVLQRIPDAFLQLGEAFKANLASLVSVAGLPVTLAFNGVANLLRYRESVLLEIGNPPTPPRDPEITLMAAKDLVFVLKEAVKDPELAEAAAQLMRQSLVQVWSIFEALASELFIALVNNKPSLADLLWRDERTKKKFQLRDTASLFQNFGYDLSKCLGAILAEQHRIDDVDTIRCVFDVLFPRNHKLRELLLQDQLWHLFQRRNLIIHRRGIVDPAYLRNTGEDLAVGARLQITPKEIARYVLLVSKTGEAMLAGLIE